MKVLILVGLAFLSIIQLQDAVELNSEVIIDGRHGTNRLKREINVGNDNFGVNDNCVGDANCNSKGEKRHSNTGNGYGNGMNSNCHGPNCNRYQDIRHENRNGRYGEGQVNVGNDNHNGMNVNCNGIANCNSGQRVSHPNYDPYQQNTHGDHQVDVGNGNRGIVQFNCNGVGRCNSGSAPTRNCDYRNGYIFENGRKFRKMTHEEIDKLNEYKQQISAYSNRIDQVKQHRQDLAEKFTEHVTMEPLPAVPNPPCFCRIC